MTQAMEKGHIMQLSDVLNSKKGELQKAANNVLNIDYLLRITLSAVQKNPLLAKCSIASIVTSVMDAAMFGLVPNSLTNEGHLVPFWSSKLGCYECQFMPGYKGLIKLATNTGLIDGVDVRCFYEKDDFDFCYGMNPQLNHKPSLGDRGAFVGAYAVVFTKDGRQKFEVFSAIEAEAYFRRFSKSKSKDGKYFGPWVDHFPEMVMKTALRKCLKYCATSRGAEKLSEAIQKDENFDNGFELDITPPEITPPRRLGEANPTPPPTADPPPENEDKTEPTPPKNSGDNGGGKATGKQIGYMRKLQKKAHLTDAEFGALLKDKFNIDRLENLKYEHVNPLIELLNKGSKNVNDTNGQDQAADLGFE